MAPYVRGVADGFHSGNGTDHVELGEVAGAEEEVDYNATCWKDLRNPTSPQSYGAYLEANSRSTSKFPKIRSQWTLSVVPLLDTQKYIAGSCSVLDISASGNTSSILCIRDRILRRHTTKLLEVLRDPPASTCTRLLVLDISPTSIAECWPVVGPLLDAVGLGLKLDPKVMEAYLEDSDVGRQISPPGYYTVSHGVVGRSIFTVAKDYLPNRRSCPPVILILDNPVPGFVSEVNEGSLFEGSGEEQSQSAVRAWPDTYASLLRRHQEPTAGVTFDLGASLLRAVLPLLEVFLEYSRAELARETSYFLAYFGDGLTKEMEESREDDFENLRFSIGQGVQNFESCMRKCRKYFRTHGAPKSLTDESFLAISEEIQLYLRDARNLETSIRDWLQLHVGNLALQQSKKSIELSNLQIAESKRVKIFTILAFIYIPLNLATSIFGMNIMELNHQGQKLWTFVITAVVALVVTGATWFLIELHAAGAQWRQQKLESQHDPSPPPAQQEADEPRKEQGYHEEAKSKQPPHKAHHNIFKRLWYLRFLLRHGFFRWMWETNAFVCILTNDRIGRLYFNESGYWGLPEVMSFNRTTVADYVAQHSFHADPAYSVSRENRTKGQHWFDPRLFFARRPPEEDKPAYPELITQELEDLAAPSSSKISSDARHLPLPDSPAIAIRPPNASGSNGASAVADAV